MLHPSVLIGTVQELYVVGLDKHPDRRISVSISERGIVGDRYAFYNEWLDAGVNLGQIVHKGRPVEVGEDMDFLRWKFRACALSVLPWSEVANIQTLNWHRNIVVRDRRNMYQLLNATFNIGPVQVLCEGYTGVCGHFRQTREVQGKTRGGIVCTVLKPGIVSVGDEVVLRY